MQRSLWVLYNFYLVHKVILVRSFPIWVIYVFTLEEVFFLFFQPSPRFLRSFEPGASSVLVISHCVPLLNVSKLMGITVFDEKTVFLSFFDLLKRLCGQIVFHIKQKPPLWESFTPFLFGFFGEFSNQVFLPHVLLKYQTTSLAPLLVFRHHQRHLAP